MGESSKRAKQAEFLAPYISDCEYTLKFGVPALRYFCCSESQEIEDQLKGYISSLNAETLPGKDELKEILSNIELVTDYATYLFMRGFNSTPLIVDNNFAPPLDTQHMEYVRKVMKAFDAKQKHAPGFDSTGGISRGGRS